MLVDKSDLNFGKRLRRYSMLVRNGVEEKIFVEPEEPGDPFKVSDADRLLHYFNQDARERDQVPLLTREGCARRHNLCRRAAAARHLHRALGAIAARTVQQLFVSSPN